jgi:capsular exopolysaccharide synthesis family protein
MEETISLKELFQTLKKRLSLIIIITAIAAATSGLISYFILTPIYQSSTQILVNQAKSDQQVFNPGEVQTNLQLINTYNVIIKSPAILDKVIQQLDLDMSSGQLNANVTVGSEQDSQVVNISVLDEDPKQAAEIANTIAAVFQKDIAKIMNVNNVSILSKAELGTDPSPIKPQPVMNIAIALVVGLMAGVGLAFLLEYLDNTIKTEEDIEKHLGLPVLGAITRIDMEQELKNQKNAETQISRTRGETIRTNIQFSTVDEEISSMIVTSAGPGEGKSTTAANVAVVFAQQGKKVLLIDGDLRKPTAHYTFKVDNHVGLTNVLTRQSTLSQAAKHTDQENLYLLTSGPIPPNPSELLASKGMKQMIEDAKREYDLVIFDTPPVLVVTDAQILSNAVDGVVLVVSSGKTELEGAKKAKDALVQAQAKILGTVLNNKKQQDNQYYYYASK